MATWTTFVPQTSFYAEHWGRDRDGLDLAAFQMGLSSSTRLVFRYDDGTYTYLNGTGLSHANGIGTISWTSLTSAEYVAADGTTVIERVTGFNPAVTSANNEGFFSGGLLNSDDTLTGTSGIDSLYGYNGTNTFLSGAGADHCYGGTGNDTFRIQAGDWVAQDPLNGGAPRDIIEAGGGVDTIQLENVGNINLTGLTSVEVVRFFSGTSTVTLDGAALHGINSITGTAGVDTIIVTSANQQGGGDFSSLTFTNWTAGQDTITFNSNTFFGVVGTSQNDIFNLVSNVTVQGGGGDDTFNIGTTATTISSLDGGTGTDTIRLNAADIGLGLTTLTSVEQIVFNSGSSTVTINGGGTSSPLPTLPNFIGSAGIDRLVFTGFRFTDLTGLSLSSWTSGVDTITITGFDSDNLTGSNFSDTINAGVSADTLNGKGGADALFGGAGADKFVFDAVALSDAQSGIFDTIKDYDQGGGVAYNFSEGDRIDLSAILATAYNQGNGQPIGSLVRVVESIDGTFAQLQIDQDGAANGANWVGLARLDGIHTGNNLSIVLDASLAAVTVSSAEARYLQPSFVYAGFGAGPNAGVWESQRGNPRQLADVNGDGSADIIGFGYGGVSVSLATGNGGFATSTVELGAFGSGPNAGLWQDNNLNTRQLADVNGDGRADIVGFGYNGLVVSLATPGGHFAGQTQERAAFGTGPTGGGWDSYDSYPRILADVNGDHMADVVGFSYSGVVVSLATGGGHFATQTFELPTFGAGPNGGGWSSNNEYPRLVADVNGDGMADIVGFGYSGVSVSLATGGGHFAAPSFVLSAFGAAPAAGGWTSNEVFPRHLADMNGDGKIDIVGFYSTGVFVARGNGDGTFQAPVADLQAFGSGPIGGGWTSNDSFPRLLGDVNHDGAADIIGFGYNGVYESLSNGLHLI